MINYYQIIIASWMVFLIVWAVASLNVKRDIRGGMASLWGRFFIFRLAIAGLLIFVATQIFTNTAHYSVRESIYTKAFYSVPVGLGWVAALLTVCGIAFAISARYHLGRNWSGVPSVKEGHELVTSGPYKLVRHPIYTGMLLAAFGTALSGSLVGLFVLIFGSIVFIMRIKKEEWIMRE